MIKGQALLVLVMAFAPVLAAQGKQEPKGAEDRRALMEAMDRQPEKVVALAHEIRDQPISERTRPILSLLVEYGINSQKPQVVLDTDILGDLLKEKDSQSKGLVASYALVALTCWSVTHDFAPAGLDHDSVEASWHEMLTLYRNILRDAPSERSAFLDQMIAKEESGGLGQWVDERLAAIAKRKAAKVAPVPPESDRVYVSTMGIPFVPGNMWPDACTAWVVNNPDEASVSLGWLEAVMGRKDGEAKAFLGLARQLLEVRKYAEEKVLLVVSTGMKGTELYQPFRTTEQGVLFFELRPSEHYPDERGWVRMVFLGHSESIPEVRVVNGANVQSVTIGDNPPALKH